MPSLERLRCPNCGELNPAGEAVCFRCGRPLEAGDAPGERPPPGPPPVVPCPVCRRVMVEAHEYRAGHLASHLAMSESRHAGSFDPVWLVCGLLWGWRLRRALREYPATLICANCGHLLKRRRADETPA